MEDYSGVSHVVVAFALVHWIYSCSEESNSLDAAVAKLAARTSQLLLVEWIAPDDAAIVQFGHTSGAQAGYDGTSWLRTRH